MVLQQQAVLPAWGTACLWLGIVLHFLLFAIRPLLDRPGVKLFAMGLALVAGFLVGFGWASLRAEWRLAEALDPAWEGRDIRVLGTVASLPASFERGSRFEFQVEEVLTPEAQVPSRLWLSRYEGSEAEGAEEVSEDIQPGQRWAFTVRLRRPHGQMNPGGFDYEAWLLQRGLRATGYVRAQPAPERLESGLAWPPMLWVHRVRQTVGERFRQVLDQQALGGILVALAIGDQRAIPDDQWQIFNRTGTTHLMAISGLHVTLIGALVGWLVNGLWRRLPGLCLVWPARKAALLAGGLAALAYGVLSGWGIPAQRTCLMLGVAVLALLSGRQVGAGRILLLALWGVLFMDPWAVLAPGFWLSFGIVSALLWGASRAFSRGAENSGWWARGLRAVGQLGASQWIATLASLPLLLWAFHQFPFIAPLANLLAIPIVSLLVTPLALLAVLLPWGPDGLLLGLAHGILQGLMWGLGELAQMPVWQVPAAPGWTVALAGLGIAILLLPSGIPGRLLAPVLLAPLLFWPASRLAPGALRMVVLDVGQGQAVLLQTAEHTLLYDAGPAYGSDDAGRRIIQPYLTRLGVDTLDGVVLSHKDRDHSGGWDSLAQGVKVGRLISSMSELPGVEPCYRGLHWTWDHVEFQILHPPAGTPLVGDNRDSCVLRVETKAGRILLTGDIGVREEALLLAEQGQAISAEVLLVPHHGSTTSSSLAFVAAVGADKALISAGYRNRFGHPRPQVLERYEGLGSQIWRTDRDGALILDVGDEGMRLSAWRQVGQRYWWGR